MAFPRTEYVVGLFFSEDYEQIALIRKNRPDWQKGKLNGVGGKVENHEPPDLAMIREFHEEAGYYTQDWRRFCILHESRATIAFYETSGDITTLESKTDEKLEIVDVKDISNYNIISNLIWMIPLAKDRNYFNGVMFENVKQHNEKING